MSTALLSIAYQLATYIKASADFREESFDQGAANAMLAEVDEADKAGMQIFPDIQSCYKVSLLDACKKECPKELAMLVYYMLYSCWSEAIKWANETLAVEDRDSICTDS